jgi:hypothetical protein
MFIASATACVLLLCKRARKNIKRDEKQSRIFIFGNPGTEADFIIFV